MVVHKYNKNNTDDNLNKWNSLVANVNPKTYQGMYELYKYTTLREIFPWVNIFRAGMVVLSTECKNGAKEFEMLLVHQKPHYYTDEKGYRKLMPLRKGPPKGASDPDDVSALQTAQRELTEETGIDITDPKYNSRLCITTFLHRRTEYTIQELFIYFIVIVDKRPAVKICTKELIGYEWVNVKKSLHNIDGATKPTLSLLTALENVNFWGPISTVIPVDIARLIDN